MATNSVNGSSMLQAAIAANNMQTGGSMQGVQTSNAVVPNVAAPAMSAPNVSVSPVQEAPGAASAQAAVSYAPAQPEIKTGMPEGLDAAADVSKKGISAKKIAIGIAAAAGVAALTIGGIYLHKTSPKTVQQEGEALRKIGEDLKAKADDVFEYAQKQIDEVTDIFKKDKGQLRDGVGEIKDEAGKVIRKYSLSDGEEGTIILSEYADDVLKREAHFNADKDNPMVNLINEYVDSKVNIISREYDGWTVKKGVKEINGEDFTHSADEIFELFEDGRIGVISQNTKFNINNYNIAAENRFEFYEDTGLSRFYKDYSELLGPEDDMGITNFFDYKTEYSYTPDGKVSSASIKNPLNKKSENMIEYGLDGTGNLKKLPKEEIEFVEDSIEYNDELETIQDIEDNIENVLTED